MALDFKRWLLRKLGGDQQQTSVEEITWGEMFHISAEGYVRELAFCSAVGLIGAAVGKCEFRTFSGATEVQGEEYYTWNVEPNKNQNSTVFLQNLIWQLYRNNEALVIESGGQLLVADSFCRKPYALYEDVFSQVQVGDFTFSRSFTQGDVLYFSLGRNNVKQLLDGLYGVYSKLLEYTMKSYCKSRGSKAVLELDAMAFGDETVTKRFEEIRNGEFRTFAEAESAALPLWKGMTLKELGSKTYSNEGTRDIRAMVDDVSDFTAKVLGIHPALLRGNVEGTQDALEHTLTFCIDPLCNLLQEEINRKRYGKRMLKGDYLQIDTKCIKHIDLFSIAGQVDKLVASGVWTVNDIRKAASETPLEEEWANTPFITRNYTQVRELAREGGTDEK